MRNSNETHGRVVHLRLTVTTGSGNELPTPLSCIQQFVDYAGSDIEYYRTTIVAALTNHAGRYPSEAGDAENMQYGMRLLFDAAESFLNQRKGRA